MKAQYVQRRVKGSTKSYKSSDIKDKEEMDRHHLKCIFCKSSLFYHYFYEVFSRPPTNLRYFVVYMKEQLNVRNSVDLDLNE